ncbi:hypothetical protein [Bacillus sp. KH172YL63]|uniref:hypothetical protein n=1 Tax=Bacillus sp. KH172YL63 TaxID=2709784 RepID=UPI0013E4B388|nr:hypothetical protein [Bacillus sp. KH172YL63]BCB02744.1 hypothetical protein KH172YL63_08770 [Bacillus sp. KH172YL63]
MYLADMNFWDIVRKQFLYKIKAYRGVYSSLMVIQILAILFSFLGTGMHGGGAGTISFEVRTYSSSVIIGFMMIWAFIISVIMTTKAYRYDDFTFITNRLTGHLSNILFLLFASMIGGITTFMADFLVKDFMMIMHSSQYVFIEAEPSLFGVLGAVLYLFLFSAFGYACGMLVQISRLFLIVIPLLMVGTSIITSFITGDMVTGVDVAGVFFDESSFMIFFMKVVLTALPLLAVVTYLSNKLEVRQ